MLTRHTRVLIADGDAELRRQLYSELLDLDIYSDSVRDGKVALEFLRDRAYAIVILDLAIERADPLQIIEAIRQLPAERRPMLLVTTAGDHRPPLDADVVQIVLRKPFLVGDIAAIIRSCISSSRTVRAPRAETAAANEDRAPRP